MRRLFLIYLLLLAASQLVRLASRSDGVPRPYERVASVGEVSGERWTARPVRVAYFDSSASAAPEPPVLVLLHGSPGDNGEVLGLARALAGSFRVLAPDLPGFGGSSRRVPDYSIRAHGRYLLQLLDSLGVRRAHLLGFSMGGGVALSVADLAPERVASLTLLSSIGVQEYELLGDYAFNHLIHGIQLGGLWLLRNAIPHFGLLDDGMITREYARNFYDSDQRPLRAILSRFAAPMLIVQGKQDPLVPSAIATEHARLVPQSELLMLEEGHFMAFQRVDLLAPPIGAFLARVERGEAATRATATPDRLRAAAAPFDPRQVPRLSGIALAVLLLLIAAATLVSEDFTCLATGLLVSRGMVGFLPGTAACLVGIVGGDLLLYGTGRWLGRPFLEALGSSAHPWLHPFRALRAATGRASEWLARRGPIVILTSRFVPGSRLPTFVAAGILNTGLLAFAGYFFLAALLWTPLLVGLAALYGEAAAMLFAGWQRWSLPLLGLLALALLLVLKLVIPLCSWRGRRLLLSRWRRWTRWEFWPRWLFYPPIALYLLWLGLKHRGLTVFTAANHAIPGGGLVGESKWAILQRLAAAGAPLPPTTFLAPDAPATAKLAQLERFQQEHGLSWPLVLKPDIGERGDGVAIVRSASEALAYFSSATGGLLLQAFVPGQEYGVFYYRMPGNRTGQIFSITDKRLTSVAGDGSSTLEALILKDERAVCMAPFFLEQHSRKGGLWRVPAAGERVDLGELGTHCRGARFLEGSALAAPALLEELDRIARGFDGFHFGRYDVRASSLEDFQAGRFVILELNGVSSEATSIYDPRKSLREAYATLRAQWRLAFEIGARNRALGARPAGFRELLSLFRRHRAARRAHAAT